MEKCKLLGSHLDTQTDINRRRGLIINNMKNHKRIYKSKHLSHDLKIRHFNCLQTSNFLYNCALWTLTATMEKNIDAFHRRQLRYALGIHYPKKISMKTFTNSQKLYHGAKQFNREGFAFLVTYVDHQRKLQHIKLSQKL